MIRGLLYWLINSNWQSCCLYQTTKFKIITIQKGEIMSYFVFEYFLKSTNEPFYVGRGYMDSYFKGDKPVLVSKMERNFEVDTRIISSGLDYDTSKEIQEKLLIEYSSKGYKLANVQTPYGSNGAYHISYEFEYMVTPPMVLTDFDLHYFGEYDTWDKVDGSYLVKTSYNPNTRIMGDYTNVYLNEKYSTTTQKVSEIEANVSNNLQQILSNKLDKKVRVYKSHSSKSVQSVIFSHNPGYETISKLRQEGKKIYHLVDVLKYLNKDIKDFY